MDATLLMMVKALYPDHVDIRYVPSDWVRVMTPVWTDDPDGVFRADNTNNPDSVVLNFEEVELQELAEGVWAGMSAKTRTVFVKVEGL